MRKFIEEKSNQDKKIMLIKQNNKIYKILTT